MIKKIHIGFTGTRLGMSENQKNQFSDHLGALTFTYPEVHFHHGCCIGADIEADVIARNHKCWMHLHPSTFKATQVQVYEFGDILYSPAAPLVRDLDIVKASSILNAAPRNDKIEQFRGSGSWATIRYGKKVLGEGYVIILER